MLVSPISYEYKTWFNRGFGFAVIIQIGLWGNTILSYFFKDVLAREADASKTTVLRAISIAARLALWIAMTLLILDNFGINITTLVAGLGIGGIAVALGVQKIVGDIFASLSIVMDKPFVIGDFITVDEHRGNVEDIGIKTTRIRSINGERIIFSNSDLLESRIRNYTQMQRRRVEVIIGVTYETPIEKLKMATKLIEESVKKAGNTYFEYAHFTKFADSSLNIEVAYWINDQSLGKYYATQEDVSLLILESFNKNEIEFAYPTQRQYFDSSALEKLAGNKFSNGKNPSPN
jgi:small-conductance mechanosensitive channel